MRRVMLFCALLALAGCGGLVKQEKEAPADSVVVEPAVPDTSSGGGS